jgi:hypothetical protein
MEDRLDKNRILAAVLDFQLTFTLIHIDMTSMAITWNSHFSKGKLEGGSILDSPKKFFAKMDIHRECNAFTLRYRAFWDKFMGLIVLLLLPEKYDAFFSSKSRKKYFQTLFKESDSHMDEVFLTEIQDLLTQFDNQFRTPEAHGAGVLRKWTLSMEEMADNPSFQLVDYLNTATKIMMTLNEWFSTGKFQQPCTNTTAN